MLLGINIEIFERFSWAKNYVTQTGAVIWRCAGANLCVDDVYVVMGSCYIDSYCGI